MAEKLIKKRFDLADLANHYDTMTDGTSPLSRDTELSIFLQHNKRDFEKYNVEFFKDPLPKNSFIMPDSSLYFVRETFAKTSLTNIPFNEWYLGYPDFMWGERMLAARFLKKQIFYDGFYAFVLMQEQMISWENYGVISFLPAYGSLRVNQIQGRSSIVSKGNWSRALLTYTLDWASSAGIPSVSVRRGLNNDMVFNFITEACELFGYDALDLFGKNDTLDIEKIKQKFPNEREIMKLIEADRRKNKKQTIGLIGPQQAYQVYDVTAKMVARHSGYQYACLNSDLSGNDKPDTLKSVTGDHLFITNPSAFYKLASKNNWKQFL